MPKSNRGGRGASPIRASFSYAPQQQQQAQQSAQQQQQQQQTQQQVQQAQPVVAYNDFLKMTDDEKAQVIQDMINLSKKDAVPNWLDDSITQRLAYNLELDATPNVVDAKTFDSMNGTTYYRTVGDAYDSKTGAYYKPDEIADQLLYGDITRYNSGGGTALGNGIYFADSYNGSSYYGYVSSNRSQRQGVQKVMVRMKLSNNANAITGSQIKSMVSREENKGSKLGQQLSRLSRDDKYTVYALCKGYDVIHWNTGSGYSTVVNRRGLVFDTNYKSSPDRYNSW